MSAKRVPHDDLDTLADARDLVSREHLPEQQYPVALERGSIRRRGRKLDRSDVGVPVDEQHGPCGCQRSG
jgi:hypothetical protein